MELETKQALAQELYEGFRDHTPVPLISPRFPEMTADEAYEVQQLNAQRALSLGQKLVGYKIGLTAAELMRSMEVEEPDYGRLYADMEIPANGNAPFDRMFEPKVEGEIAFVLGKDLPPEADAQTVLAALDHVRASFEFPETRIPGWQNRIVDTVSDNSSAGHFMLSPQTFAPTGLDFPQEHLTLRKNGQVIGEGTAEVILGNPLKSVAWLSNKLYAQYGKGLLAGQVILAGALCGAHATAKGDVIEAEFSTLGKLSVTMG
jgi:2-keto-4-pentenoate hydratase